MDSYDGFGGTQPGGGANFASPSQGTMNQYGGGGGSGAGAKKRDPQSLRRVTIKQCNEAVELPNGKFSIDGAPIQQVLLVANVLTLTVRETNIELSVEDGSGTITVRMYLDDGEAAQQSIKESEYRTIIGTLKKIGGALCVVAFTLAPVEDHNALTMHLLDVILTHQRATLGAPKQQGAAAGGMMQQGTYAKPENGMQVDYNGGYQPMQQQQGGYVGAAPAGGHLNDQVLWQFKHGPGCTDDNGLSIDDVVRQLGNQFSRAQVHEAIAALADQGHLYTTCDDDHYKSTA